MQSKSRGSAASDIVVLTVSELDQLISRFTTEYLSDRSIETAGTYGRSLNEFQRYHAPIASSFKFRSEDVEGYKTHLVDVRNLHQVSVSTYLTALRRFCQFLVDDGRLEDNPATSVKGNRRPDDHSRHVLKRSEIHLLMQTVEGDSLILKRDLAFIASMAFAGLSEIEIVRSDYRDLDQTLMGWFLRVQGKGRRATFESCVRV